MKPLSDCQQRMLDYLKSFFLTHGYHANYREMMAALGYASTAPVQNALDALEQKGYIIRKPNSPRAIQLVGYRVKLEPE